MSSRAFDRLLDEMLATVTAEGIIVSRELLREKLIAACWDCPAVLDDDGRIVDFLTGDEVAWPPIAH